MAAIMTSDGTEVVVKRAPEYAPLTVTFMNGTTCIARRKRPRSSPGGADLEVPRSPPADGVEEELEAVTSSPPADDGYRTPPMRSPVGEFTKGWQGQPKADMG